jgi:hypothetical protein
MNEEAVARVGLQRHVKKIYIYNSGSEKLAVFIFRFVQERLILAYQLTWRH